jgi:hypothetical protein
MDSQDVRMVQCRNRARFLFETPQSIGVIASASGSTTNRGAPGFRVACDSGEGFVTLKADRY